MKLVGTLTYVTNLYSLRKFKYLFLCISANKVWLFFYKKSHVFYLENFTDRGALRDAVHWVTKSQTWLSTHTRNMGTNNFFPLNNKTKFWLGLWLVGTQKLPNYSLPNTFFVIILSLYPPRGWGCLSLLAPALSQMALSSSWHVRDE